MHCNQLKGFLRGANWSVTTDPESGSVLPTPQGTPFRLTAEAAADAGSAVQVDLVGGAEVWYTWRDAKAVQPPPPGG